MPFPGQLGAIPDTPPGQQSPGALLTQFTPSTQFPYNSAPVLGAPYFVARAQTASSVASLAVPVQNPTGVTDAIVVAVTTGGSGADAPVGVTDTQGNAYVQLVNNSVNNQTSLYAAFNTRPLTAADTITATITSNNPIGVVVIGCPSTALTGIRGGWLSSVMTAAVNSGGSVGRAITAPFAIPASLSSPVLLVVADGGAITGEVFSQGWTLLGQTSGNVSGARMSVSIRVVTSPITSGLILCSVQRPATGGGSLILAALIPETRFAPNRPAPDMPPGMQSPGAWQYAPLGNPPEGPATLKYSGSPYKFVETLPASSVSHGAVVKTAGKQVKATPVAQGVMTRVAARSRTLAATPHAAGTLIKTASRHLTLAATTHPAGKLIKSAGKRLAGTVRSAGTLAHGFGLVLNARVTSLARLIKFGSSSPVFNLGIPQTGWAVSISTIGLSQLATQYVDIPVAATRAGLSYNPTGDTVQMAFMPTATQVPGNSDWQTAVWETDTTNIIYPYSAKCLVGPSGTITLGIGTYIIYLKVVDSPEIPILICGQLQIS